MFNINVGYISVLDMCAFMILFVLCGFSLFCLLLDIVFCFMILFALAFSRSISSERESHSDDETDRSAPSGDGGRHDGDDGGNGITQIRIA